MASQEPWKIESSLSVGAYLECTHTAGCMDLASSLTGRADYGSLSRLLLAPPELAPPPRSSSSLMDIIQYRALYMMTVHNMETCQILCSLYRKSICRVDVLLITSRVCQGDRYEIKISVANELIAIGRKRKSWSDSKIRIKNGDQEKKE